eukprot:5462756-Alexandrium_andersonii.AAC.1
MEIAKGGAGRDRDRRPPSVIITSALPEQNDGPARAAFSDHVDQSLPGTQWRGDGVVGARGPAARNRSAIVRRDWGP